MKFAQNIPDAPIGFSNKDISVTLGTYIALDQKFKKKKSTASMPTSGREPADFPLCLTCILICIATFFKGI